MTPFAAAGAAVAKAMLVLSFGVVLARTGFVNAPAVKQLNAFTVHLLLPCMLFAHVAESATLAGLATDWLLPAHAVVHIGLGFAVTSALAWVCRLSPSRRRVVVMAGTFGNGNLFPLILLTSLAPVLVPDDPLALDRAFGNVSVYLLGWSVLCWTAGWEYAGRPIAAEPPTKLAAQPSVEESAGRGSSVTEESSAGGTIALSSSVGGRLWAHQHAASRPVAAVWARLPERDSMVAMARRTLNAPIVAVLAGLLVGISPAKRLLVGANAPLAPLQAALLLVGDACIPVGTVLLGAVLGADADADDEAEGQGHAGTEQPWWHGLPLDAALAFIVRAGLMPALGLALYSLDTRCIPALATGGGPGDDGRRVGTLLRLVLLLQTAMPTANNVVVMLNQRQAHNLSRRAAAILAVQMIVAPLSLTAWLTLFIRIVT